MKFMFLASWLIGMISITPIALIVGVIGIIIAIFLDIRWVIIFTFVTFAHLFLLKDGSKNLSFEVNNVHYIRGHTVGFIPDESPSQGITNSIRSKVQDRLQRLKKPVAIWGNTLLLGQVFQGDNNQLKDSLKRIGLYHTVVISGLHVSVIAMIGNASVLFLLRFFCAFAGLRGAWVHEFARAMMFGSFFLILIFVSISGMGPASQRALLIFLLHCCIRILDLPIAALHLLIGAAIIQSLYFAEQVFGYSFNLSWICYLIVLSSGRAAKKQGRYKILTQRYFTIQFSMFLVVALFFDQLTMATFFSNFLLMPFFYFAGALLLFYLAFPGFSYGLSFCNFSANLFLVGVEKMNLLISKYDWLYIGYQRDSGFYSLIKFLVFSILCLICLNLFRKMPTRVCR